MICMSMSLQNKYAEILTSNVMYSEVEPLGGD